PRALRDERLDPIHGWRRVAERRHGRNDCFVRVEPQELSLKPSLKGASPRAEAKPRFRRSASANPALRAKKMWAKVQSTLAQKNSASRWRFRPPRPTGLPPRGCPLLVEPLGQGFDLVALRARCRRERIRKSCCAARGLAQKISRYLRTSCATRNPHRVFAAAERTPVEP